MTGNQSPDSDSRESLEELADRFMENYRRGEPPAMEELCRNSPDLASEIRDLFGTLVMMEELGSVEEHAGDDTKPIERLGEYRILRRIGQGGMGCVYEAEDEKLGRHVALKVLPFNALLKKDRLERFRREARAAAQLNHPHIVPVFGSGESEGTYYYVMQYIRGQSLDAVISQIKLLRQEISEAGPSTSSSGKDVSRTTTILLLDNAASCSPPHFEGQGQSLACLPGQPKIGARSNSRHPYFSSVARLGFQVADALAYSHSEGVLHRDIKPSNLILDAEGRVWVTDFGLAKVPGNDHLTQTGDLLGTLAYMAPERLEGWSDTRSDIYGLGLTLYEMVTLRPAFQDSEQRLLMKRIAEESPVRPRGLNRTIPRDLETIIWKAIEKEPADRYQSATQMREDLQRFLEGREILARRSGPLLRARNWARRNPILACTTLALILVLSAALAVALLLLDRVNDERDKKASALVDVRKAFSEKEKALKRADGLRLAGQSSMVRDENPGLALLIAAEGAERVSDLVTDQALRPAIDAIHERRTLIGPISSVQIATFSPDGKMVLTAQAARGNLPARLWDVATGKLIRLLQGDRPIQWAVFSPNGQRILTIEMEAMLRVWETETGKQLWTFRTSANHMDQSSFSPDGRKLMVPWLKSARLVDMESGGELTCLRHYGLVISANFSPDGRRIVTCSRDQTVRIWDTATGEQLVLLDGLVEKNKTENSQDGRPGPNNVKSASFSSNGTMLLTASENESRIWDVETGKLVNVVRGMSAHFSPDSKKLLIFENDRSSFHVTDFAGGDQVVTLKGHADGFNFIGLSPDGQRIATASRDKAVRVWDAASGVEIAVLRGHVGHVGRVDFSPDGKLLVTASSDGTARIWDIDGELDRLMVLAAQSELEKTSKRDLAENEVQRMLRELNVPNWEVARANSDGSMVVSGSPDRYCSACIEVMSGMEIVGLVGHNGKILSACFGPDDSKAATASEDMTACVWDVAKRESNAFPISPSWRLRWISSPIAVLKGHTGAVLSVVFSPDGTKVATASKDKTSRIWDAKTGETIAVLCGHTGAVLSAVFSPDGKKVLTRPGGNEYRTSNDNTARLWDAHDGRVLLVLTHPEKIDSAIFNHDGTQVLTVSSSGGFLELAWTARGWDVSSGKELFAFTHRGGAVSTALFSPDDKQVIIGAEGAYLLDTETGREMAYLDGVGRWTPVRFGLCGRAILVGSQDGGGIRVYPVFPLTVARERLPRALTPDEVDTFEVGSFEERRDYRLSWRLDQLMRDLSCGAETLAIQRGHSGLRDYVANVLREVISLIATPTAGEAAPKAWKDAFEAVKGVAEDPQIRNVLAELEDLGRHHTEEVMLRSRVTPLVDRLFDERIWGEQVIDAIELDASLEPRTKETALRMARSRPPPTAVTLNAKIWEVIRRTDKTPADYARALASAEVACKLDGANPEYLNTLGLAQYRAGMFEEALGTLTRADEVNQAVEVRRRVMLQTDKTRNIEMRLENEEFILLPSHHRNYDLLFIAMCHWKLGRAEEARKLFTEARKLALQDNGSELREFLAEAKALIHE
jgi:WD40 repeat protein/serine/threonine protein kinase/tetratricopeptide (TPR) repeat protein